jgi:hypothetical protein
LLSLVRFDFHVTKIGRAKSVKPGSWTHFHLQSEIRLRGSGILLQRRCGIVINTSSMYGVYNIIMLKNLQALTVMSASRLFSVWPARYLISCTLRFKMEHCLINEVAGYATTMPNKKQAASTIWWVERDERMRGSSVSRVVGGGVAASR